MDDILTKRTIGHDEAREAMQRLVNSAFRNGKESARFGIPARPDYDDDLVLSAYIRQQALKELKDIVLVPTGPACACCKQQPRSDCDNPACAFKEYAAANQL